MKWYSAYDVHCSTIVNDHSSLHIKQAKLSSHNNTFYWLIGKIDNVT